MQANIQHKTRKTVLQPERTTDYTKEVWRQIIPPVLSSTGQSNDSRRPASNLRKHREYISDVGMYTISSTAVSATGLKSCVRRPLSIPTTGFGGGREKTRACVEDEANGPSNRDMRRNKRKEKRTNRNRFLPLAPAPVFSATLKLRAMAPDLLFFFFFCVFIQQIWKWMDGWLRLNTF